MKELSAYDKIGEFYLGKPYDLSKQKTADDFISYPSKNLTTHAVCVGMTGSGKTGLCLSLIEEAAIDGIPTIAIDPKGDIGNLLLAFPELRPADFQPWVDPDEAKRQGLSVDQFAEKTAEKWKAGLAEWGQDPARVKRFKDSVDIAIYTPGSTIGIPITVMRSFTAPSQAVMQDMDLFRQRINASVAGLLALLSIEADPLQSREHILLSSLLEKSWREGKDVELAGLIAQIQSPPIAKIGVIDLETFYPSQDRFQLAMRLNNLLASPGFAAWMQGEPLDIQKLFYTSPEGKPRITILSIAHLSDAERMFFVTILLNELLSWMRSQSGTSSLRALFYMDEIFGYFPPIGNPPSKTPMLTLLKQARAFGLGIMLATQNPVDLDYKGLSNCGTWFLGRLQTERDKARVLDGLEGASAQAGAAFDRGTIDKILSSLGQRVFLLNNVAADKPVVFQSRWSLSYLRGPLSREQISFLMASRKGNVPTGVTMNAGNTRPVLPPEIQVGYLPVRGKLDSKIFYRPALLGVGKVHFVNAKAKLDNWQDVAVLAPVEGDGSGEVWESGNKLDGGAPDLDDSPLEGAEFSALGKELTKPKNYSGWSNDLKGFVFRTETLTQYECKDEKMTSNADESEADFRVRVAHQLREQRDASVDDINKKYAPKMVALDERLRKALARVDKEKAESQQHTLQTILAVGGSILGAVFGGGKKMNATSISKASTAMRSAGRMMTQKGDVEAAEESTEAVQALKDKLAADMKKEIDDLDASIRPDALTVTKNETTPRKADTSISRVVLVWCPFRTNATGDKEQAYL
jgi:hypothetical protein